MLFDVLTIMNDHYNFNSHISSNKSRMNYIGGSCMQFNKQITWLDEDLGIPLFVR